MTIKEVIEQANKTKAHDAIALVKKMMAKGKLSDATGIITKIDLLGALALCCSDPDFSKSFPEQADDEESDSTNESDDKQEKDKTKEEDKSKKVCPIFKQINCTKGS